MSGDRKRPIEEEPEYDYDALLSFAEEEMADPKPLRKRLKSASHDDVQVTEIIERKTSRLAPVLVERTKKPLPTRLPDRRLFFKDFPEFQPNLTPKEIIKAGSFGGCYFQRLASAVTGQTYVEAWREFPSDWFEGLVVSEHVASPTYNKDVNTYKVSCGSSVQQWEESGWVTEIDPFGWFQWYCRFYLGRRCSDDYRQINRALGVMGPSGRWRKNLINKCLSSGKRPEEACDDFTISPKIRQLLQVSKTIVLTDFDSLALQQWGYRLILDDLLATGSPKKKKSDP